MKIVHYIRGVASRWNWMLQHWRGRYSVVSLRKKTQFFWIFWFLTLQTNQITEIFIFSKENQKFSHFFQRKSEIFTFFPKKPRNFHIFSKENQKFSFFQGKPEIFTFLPKKTQISIRKRSSPANVVIQVPWPMCIPCLEKKLYRLKKFYEKL